jgi:FkbM family methyltransferase
LFLDVGANIGAYTVLAAGVTKARVIAFEPNPRTFSQLRKNLEINQISEQVRTVNAAVGRSPAKLRLTDDLGTENYVITGAGAGIEVPVWPLDEQLGGAIPKLLKIDVEGFETEAFAGAARLLGAPALQAMIVERNNSGARYGFDEGELHRTIRSAGFSPFAYEPFTRKLSPLPSEALGNLIYLRDLVAVQQMVQSSPGYSFTGLVI